MKRLIKKITCLMMAVAIAFSVAPQLPVNAKMTACTAQMKEMDNCVSRKKKGLKDGSYMVTNYKFIKIKKNTVVVKSGLAVWKNGEKKITYKTKKRTFKKSKKFKILGYGVDENMNTDTFQYTVKEFNENKANWGEWGMLNIVIKNGRIKEISIIS